MEKKKRREKRRVGRKKRELRKKKLLGCAICRVFCMCMRTDWSFVCRSLVFSAGRLLLKTNALFFFFFFFFFLKRDDKIAKQTLFMVWRIVEEEEEEIALEGEKGGGREGEKGASSLRRTVLYCTIYSQCRYQLSSISCLSFILLDPPFPFYPPSIETRVVEEKDKHDTRRKQATFDRQGSSRGTKRVPE
ncbi:MAG: hypothetical protein J3R72DRAFT_52278 [Linnemannia gamsii]|nr:MAG: hypothetical protein J3R72DRAFT_52278 [Linnemannia gamsii]